MKDEFKVGDEVVVREKSELLSRRNTVRRNPGFVDGMTEFSGRLTTIEKAENGFLRLKNIPWWWSPEWVESNYEPIKEETITLFNALL